MSIKSEVLKEINEPFKNGDIWIPEVIDLTLTKVREKIEKIPKLYSKSYESHSTIGTFMIRAEGWEMFREKVLTELDAKLEGSK